MAICEVCGNEYDKAFTVALGDHSYVFDSFECAIHLLAPECSQCGCKVVGHGMESEGKFYCCANCARGEGKTMLRDRVENHHPVRKASA